MEEKKELSVSEKNAQLREEFWKQGLNVYAVGQLGRIDFLVVSHFEPDPNAPPPYRAIDDEGKPNQ